MLFPLERNPFRIDPARIPADFIRGFETRACARLSCEECGYCRDIAAEAVTIDPAFREEQSKRLAQARKKLVDGGLWGV